MKKSERVGEEGKNLGRTSGRANTTNVNLRFFVSRNS